MEKTINSFEIRRNFGKILQDVSAQGDMYIVERHGMPMAVLVPLPVYEQWKQSRKRFFAALRTAQESASLSEEEAKELAAEAVQAVRVRKEQ